MTLEEKLLDDFKKGITKFMNEDLIQKDEQIQITGVYVTSNRAEITKFIEDNMPYLGVESCKNMGRGNCIANLTAKNRVVGSILFAFEPTGNIQTEYEMAKNILVAVITTLNREGFNVRYNPNERGYRQQFMERLDRGPYGHATFGGRVFSEETAEIMVKRHQRGLEKLKGFKSIKERDEYANTHNLLQLNKLRSFE